MSPRAMPDVGQGAAGQHVGIPLDPAMGEDTQDHGEDREDEEIEARKAEGSDDAARAR